MLVIGWFTFPTPTDSSDSQLLIHELLFLYGCTENSMYMYSTYINLDMCACYIFSNNGDFIDNTLRNPWFFSFWQWSVCSNFLLVFTAYLFIALISHSVVHSSAVLSYDATLWLSPFCSFLSSQDQASKDKALQNMASLSSAQIVSPSIIKNHLPPLPPAPYQPARVSPLFSFCTASLLLLNPWPFWHN